MRILFLSLYFTPDVAANAVLMTELAEELTSRGHQITAVTSFPHYADNAIQEAYRRRVIQRDTYRGIRVLRTYVHASGRKDSVASRAVSDAAFSVLGTLAGLLTGPQDVILATSPPLTLGIAANAVGRAKRAPYIYIVQDIYPDVAVRLGVLAAPWAVARARDLEQFIYRHARCVVVPSEGFRENLLKKGVPENKISVIPNFVDTEFIRPLSRENGFRQRQGWSDDFTVLYAGNVGHSQALDSVLECADLLRGDRGIAFVIAGNGSQRMRLEAQAKEVRLDHVRFIPFQPRADVPQLYATADVGLVTLRHGIAWTSLPSKVYTIMASGRPVIAAVDRGSDIWCLLEQAQCGLCVDPEDPPALAQAIQRLRDDPDLRERLGRNGREYVVLHHSRRLVGEAYHQLFSRLAG